MARNLLTGAQITDARVRPPNHSVGPRSPAGGVLLASSTCPVPWSEDAKRDNHAAAVQRPQASKSQPARITGSGLAPRRAAAGREEQRAKLRRGDRRTNSYHATENARSVMSCHVMVITDFLWEPSPRTLFTVHNCVFLVFFGARKTSVAAVSAVRRFWISVREITAPTAKGSPSCHHVVC
jgi:hypothetical protein